MKTFEVALGDKTLSLLRDSILEVIKKEELYKPDFLYRGFSNELIEQVLLYGSESPDDYCIYANPEQYLSVDPDPQWVNPLSYARHGRALAIYQADLLRLADFTCYAFSEMENKTRSLVAVISLT